MTESVTEKKPKCTYCNDTKKFICSGCSGSKQRQCPNPACHEGLVSQGEGQPYSPCYTCGPGGNGKVPCPDCGGTGLMACPHCSGG